MRRPGWGNLTLCRTARRPQRSMGNLTPREFAGNLELEAEGPLKRVLRPWILTKNVEQTTALVAERVILIDDVQSSLGHPTENGRATMWKCEHCQEQVEDELDVCWNCGRDRTGTQVTSPDVLSRAKDDVRRMMPRDRQISEGNASPEAIAIAARYDEAYGVAEATIGHGKLVKFIGLCLGFVVAIVGVALAAKAENVTPGIIGALAGLFFGGQMYYTGVLICAQGETLLASLDTAVNTCEFLSRTERWHILGA